MRPDGPADFHCIGGFVVSQIYGFARETADLDVLTVNPPEAAERVVNYPDDYESRLVRVFPIWPNVRLWALGPHDLALTKSERSNDRDIRDVMYLAQAGLITRDALISRFETELEPFITGRTPAWHRSTLKMWVDACWPR